MIDNETFSSTDQLAKLSSNVLLEKTGKGWDTWIKWLDKAAAENLTHKALVSMLESHVESMWYRQKIALGYREAKGKRELGEIASGYEVGIRHTFPLTAKQAWQFITSREALDIWLGPLKTGKFREGSSFETTDGLTGTITVLEPGSHLRMSWQPAQWRHSSILQMRVMANKAKDVAKSAIIFHHEKLPAPSDRVDMKKHWEEKLSGLAEIIKGK